MNPALQSFLAHCQQRYTDWLDSSGAGLQTGQPEGLSAAIDYALRTGGKRIRPTLCYGAAHALGVTELTQVDNPAVALELLHTYSLVHDDLPAMDDDDLRRGRPSLHRAFDEATAILVGDGLQALAFELLASAPGLDALQKVAMVQVLTAASGPRGMVGGQFIDIQATGSDMGLEQLSAMHQLKTGALIRAALALGGIAANGDSTQLQALDEYGRHVGLAFQVVDDILDATGDSATLGKTSGKDDAANKPTYVKLLGLEGAQREAQTLLQQALATLDEFGERADLLRELARYIVARDR